MKETWIDYLRAFACLCVVIVHSPIAYDGTQGGQWILAPLNFVMMACGVAVFFMISGALLLNKEQQMIPFMKKRFARIALPILIWSAIYILLDSFETESFDFRQIVYKICLIPFCSQADIMWFMYVLIGIYFTTPILSTWISRNNKKDHEIVLLLWSITLCLPYLKHFIPQLSELAGRTGMLYNFSGFLGYAVLGSYLRKYADNMKFYHVVLLGGIALLVPAFILVFHILPKETLNGLCNLHSAALASCVFLLFKKMNCTFANGTISTIAKYSFGIYLCHVMIMQLCKVWLAENIHNYLFQIPLTAVITFLLSFTFVAALSRFRFSKYFFG